MGDRRNPGFRCNYCPASRNLWLIAIGIILMVRREVRQLAIATAIGVATGIAYMIPMVLIFGDPLANLAGYRRSDWTSGLALMLPVLPVIKSAMYGGAFVPSGRLHIVYCCVNLAWVLSPWRVRSQWQSASVSGIMQRHTRRKRSSQVHMRFFCFPTVHRCGSFTSSHVLSSR